MWDVDVSRPRPQIQIKANCPIRTREVWTYRQPFLPTNSNPMETGTTRWVKELKIVRVVVVGAQIKADVAEEEEKCGKLNELGISS